VGRFFNRQTIGIVRTLAWADRDEDKGCVDYRGGWVLTETVFLWWRSRRAMWFGNRMSKYCNYGREAFAAVDCWLKGGPVPTQYLDAPIRDKPKLRVIGGTDA
jgi:hypothetical protein